MEKRKTKIPFDTTPVFEWVYTCTKPTVVLQGGTNSSKTYSVMQYLLVQAATNKDFEITVVGDSIPGLRSGPMKDIKRIIKSSPIVASWITNYHKTHRIYTFFTGSFIQFKSFETEEEARDGKREILFINEVNKVDYDIYLALDERTTLKTIVDYNPSAHFWVHSELIGKPDVELYISNFTHNRFVEESVVKKLMKYKISNPARWLVYGLGLTGEVEGMVFSNVTWISKDDFPDEDDLENFGYGADYGFTNDPTTLVRAGKYKGKVYAELLLYKTGLTRKEIAKKLRKLKVDYDDLISFDDSQAKEQAFLLREQNGYNIKAANRKGGSIISGIELLQDYELCLVENKNWKKEQLNYMYKKHKGQFVNTLAKFDNKPVDKFNHVWDALRYWALDNLTEVQQEDYEPEAQVV